MKYVGPRPYADPEKAARRMLELANSVEPIQGRIHKRKSTSRSCSATAVGRRNTALGSNSRSSAAGSRRIRDLRNVHADRRRAVRLTGEGRCRAAQFLE